MALEIETVCRVALAVIFVGAATIGIPHRLRADRAGGSVSRRADPAWFWIGMSVAGPPLALTCLAFLIQPRLIDFSALEFAAWLRWTGVPLSLIGLGLFGWMFHHLGLNVTSTSMPRASASLVTSGPYRWRRAYPSPTAASSDRGAPRRASRNAASAASNSPTR